MGIREGNERPMCHIHIRRARDATLFVAYTDGEAALPAWALVRGPDIVFAFGSV